MNEPKTLAENLIARVENLDAIVRKQQQLIDRLALAIQGHQAVLEAICPEATKAAAAAAAKSSKDLN